MHQVSDYRDHPDFGSIIADRIWNAWWKDAGLHLADATHHLTEMVDDRPLPTALVAHDESGYLGSAFLIECDLEERPQYRPWVAAVWVEEPNESAALENRSSRKQQELRPTSASRVSYICCHRELEAFYTAFGWVVLERDVGPHTLSVLSVEV